MIVDISEENGGNKAGIYAKRDIILDALGVMLTPGAVHELRVVKAGRFKTISGYYDRPKSLADHALTLSEYERVPAVYATLNPVVPDLLARSANDFKKWAEFTTADRDVVRLGRLLIDGDPERRAGISSTDEEHDLAIARIREVRDYLVSEGWPRPMLSDSGNGAHGIFAIDLENSGENVALCKAVLQSMHARFSDNMVSIDRRTYNASRICKIPGTWARKGDDLPARPHRLSRVMESPNVLEVVPVELLERLVGTPTARPKTFDRVTPGFLGDDEPFEAPGWLAEADAHLSCPGGSWTAETLEAWFGDHDVEYRPPVEVGDRLKYVLDPCPFDQDHTGKDAAVFLTIEGEEAGMVGFHCFHDGCADRTWKDLRGQFPGPTTTTSSHTEDDGQFEQRLVVWMNAKGSDGASEAGRLANEAIGAQESPKEAAQADAKSDPYLDDLTRGGVEVGGTKVVKGSINYYTACPCCGLVGTFWRRLEDYRCGYECSAMRKSWAEGKALWKAARGPQGRKRRAFTLEELEAIPSPGWLVQGHVAEHSLVLIYGASNVGKSFYVIDIGLSIASGRPFIGRYAVRRGPVVYVVGEGAGGIRKRVKAWRKKHGVTADIPFLVIPYPFGLTTGEGEVDELVEIVREKLGDVAPALLILDTLSRHFGAGDENATKDMKAFTDACDRLVAETGATVAVVHHTGKDATRKERGNVTLRSNSDTVIFVDGFRGREGMEIECQKQKDAEYFDGYKLLRDVVTLEGEETSLVYHLDEGAASHVARAGKPAWNTDLEMVSHFTPPGVNNAKTIAQCVEDVRAGMVVCQMDPIGTNRCRTLLRSLIKNGTLFTVPSATGNANHDRYYRAEQAAPMPDFFSSPSHEESHP